MRANALYEGLAAWVAALKSAFANLLYLYSMCVVGIFTPKHF